MRERNPKNVPGPFYVEGQHCICCGAPEAEAPDLIGYDDDTGCYFRRQPETPEEVDQAIAAIAASCVAVHRYGGDDYEIRRRLAVIGQADMCDRPLVEVVQIIRNCVRFELRGPPSARAFAPVLGHWIEPDGVELVAGDDAVATFETSPGRPYMLRLSCALHRLGNDTWLLEERSGVALPFWARDRLVEHGAKDLRWLSVEEWKRGERGQPLPY